MPWRTGDGRAGMRGGPAAGGPSWTRRSCPCRPTAAGASRRAALRTTVRRTVPLPGEKPCPLGEAQFPQPGPGQPGQGRGSRRDEVEARGVAGDPVPAAADVRQVDVLAGREERLAVQSPPARHSRAEYFQVNVPSGHRTGPGPDPRSPARATASSSRLRRCPSLQER